MGVSINPTASVFKWLDNKREAQFRVADYLDQIAAEADNLAQIWQQVVEKLMEIGGQMSLEARPPGSCLKYHHGGTQQGA